MRIIDNITYCTSLDEVRQNIDTVDKELIKLIAERSYYVNQAVRFKKTTSDAIATDRVNAVINKVKDLAKKEGLEPSIAEKIYRAMIKAFTEEEIVKLNPLYTEIKKDYY